MAEDWRKGKVAEMLRGAGYQPLPRMWVTRDQYAEIVEIAKANQNHVNAVRRYVRDLEKREPAAPKEGE